MLQENERALAEHRPKFYQQIQEVSQEMEESGSVRLEQARDGNSVLVIESDGRSCRLNSAFRPVQEADRWAAQFDFGNLENIILMFGLGNGIFAQRLLKSLDRDDKFVIYEPSMQVFHLILERVDISEILSDSRVDIIVEGINASELYFKLDGYLSWRNIDALCVCEHPGYRNLFLESAQNFAKQVAECKELVYAVMHTDINLAHRTIRNFFINLRYIKHANILSDFSGKIPEDFPAIVVSAGPSLDKNIEELKRAQGRAFIFAVDSAVNMLLNHGIKIDAMITVDAKKVSSHISREECRDIPLFCGLMSKYQILGYHQGKKILVTGLGYVDALYSEMGYTIYSIHLGGSVATAAFSVCEKLGFKRIILIGQDLAYGEGVTHAGGAVRHVVNEEVGQKMIDSWFGGKVKSRYDWIIYLNWFESAIQQFPHVHVTDATEGGALIHGSEVMTLSQAIDQYCTREFSMRELLDKEPPTFDAETYEKIREKLLHLEKEMMNIKRSAGEAVIICDQVLDQIRQSGANVILNKQVKRLTALNDSICDQSIYEILDYYVTDTAVEDLKDINQMTGSKEQDLIDTYTSARAMYASLVRAVEELNGNGYGFGEEMEEVGKELEEVVLLSEQLVAMWQSDASQDEIENQRAKLSSLSEILNKQKTFDYLVEHSADEISNMYSRDIETEDEKQNLINVFSNNADFCNVYVREARKLSKIKFVHDCLKNV